MLRIIDVENNVIQIMKYVKFLSWSWIKEKLKGFVFYFNLWWINTLAGGHSLYFLVCLLFKWSLELDINEEEDNTTPTLIRINKTKSWMKNLVQS